MIKDSGDRTEFETGAKRDMHAGKGRMDLLPWYGIMEVSKHCEEGALKYGEHNVDKGIPLHSLLDSASRHLAKYMVGMDDEDHLRAACWNLLWALNQRVTHPELDDRFDWQEEEKAKADTNEDATDGQGSLALEKLFNSCKISAQKLEDSVNEFYNRLIPEDKTIRCPECGCRLTYTNGRFLPDVVAMIDDTNVSNSVRVECPCCKFVMKFNLEDKNNE